VGAKSRIYSLGNLESSSLAVKLFVSAANDFDVAVAKDHVGFALMTGIISFDAAKRAIEKMNR
jgi:hypothetical protein